MDNTKPNTALTRPTVSFGSGCGEYHLTSEGPWTRKPCAFTDAAGQEKCIKEMINVDKTINVKEEIAADIATNKELKLHMAGYCSKTEQISQTYDTKVDFSGNQAICCKTAPKPSSASSMTVSMFSLAVVAVIASLM